MSGFIHAQGGKVLWRVGAGGSIVRSADGGKAWNLQASGVTAALSAGSAPSGSVCWIVGAGGAILRTTDGGEHWQVLASPTHADLVGVAASDAENAVVWSQSPALSYTTSDGGKSWSITNSK